jgi:hypothetical protein
MKQADRREVFKKASTSAYAATIVVSTDALSPTPSTPSAMNTVESAEKVSDDPDPTDEGDIQMENSFH